MPPTRLSSSAAFALLLLLTPATTALRPQSTVAQATASQEFDLPESVTSGTVVRIDGSDSMRRINELLQQGFEEDYAGTDVQTAYSGTEAALEALAAGDIDLAAIGRPLTEEEKSQGLVEVPIERHKIALIVSPDSPFTGSVTTSEFGQIFRGEITNWSEVGGESGPIRFVDRPEDSDTRQAFRGYPIFQAAPFETGETAEAVAEDSSRQVIDNLGENGIGYAIADQVLDDPDVRILAMHNTMPDDPRYPFSQPLAYVYQGDRPSPAVEAFLGYATASENEAALEAARAQAALASVDGPDTGAGADGAGVSGTNADGADADGADADGAIDDAAPGTAGAIDGDDGAVATGPDGSADGVDGAAVPLETDEADVDEAGPWPWWWLLLLLLLPLLLFLLLRRRGTPDEAPIDADDAAPVPLAATGAVDDPAAVPPVAAGGADEAPAAVSPAAANAAADLVTSPAVDPAIGMVPAPAAIPPAAAVPPAAPEPPVAPAAAAPATDLPKGTVVLPMIPLVPLSNDIGSRVVMTSPTPQTLRAQWDIADTDRRLNAGSQMALRLHDITDLPANSKPHRTWQFPCLESDPALEVEVPDPNATYEGEIGYLTSANRWLGVARSLPIATAGALGTAGLAAAGLAAAGLGTAADSEAGLEEAQAGSAPPLASAPASQLSLSPQLSNTVQADWTLSSQDAASLSARPSPLLLRLYDTTGLDIGSGTGPLVGQFHCEPDSTSLQVPVNESDRDYVGELGYLGLDDQWVPLARSEKVRLVGPTTDGIAGTVTGVATPAPSVAEAAAVAAAASVVGAVAAEAVPAPQPESKVTLEASEPKIAIARWTLSEPDRLKLQASTRTPELRIHDVTGIDLEHQSALATQSYVLTPEGTSQIVPVPTGDRDYLAELGYFDTNSGWTTLARSAHVYIPGDDSAAAAPTPLSLGGGMDESSQIDLGLTAGPGALAQWTLSAADRLKLKASAPELRVHDVTGIDFDHQPSLGTQSYLLAPEATSQTVTVPVGDRDYLAELGYLDADSGWTTLARSSHIYIPSSSAAVQAPGTVDTDSEATQTPPDEGIAEMAIAVGLGAVAPSATSLDDGAARYAAMAAPGISQIILVPGSGEYAYAYWEVAPEQHDQIQAEGGQQFKLRVHDATGLDIDYQPPHSSQEFDCQPTERDRHVPIPVGDRDYIAEVGYTTEAGDWKR
ncbi:MAG: DUF4912 domain-containing protein, partial [Cyanobacteria bacterium P01_A01_bin.135]